ncbi:MAG: class I SAM-dependent methyltransferase [Chloroflexota bacterium]
MMDDRSALITVRSAYDRWALVYDHDANPLPALEAPPMQAALGDVRGRTVVDLGCGTGRHALWCARNGARVTGVDFSTEMMARARSRLQGQDASFVVHDMHQALPFRDGTFDCAISALVLEHIHELEPFFSEMRRVLRPQGRAVISTLHPAMFLRGSQARFTDPDTGLITRPGSVNHSFGDLVMAPVRAGFTLEAVGEHAPDVDFADTYPRAVRYVGWPMLLILSLRAKGI